MLESLNVSVVIPHYNNLSRLAQTLSAVKRETNNLKNIQVIVVDNKSGLSPRSVVEDLGFLFLEETYYLNSPYSARNRGIEKTTGDIIILLDSTCVPQKNWLKNGLEFMIRNEADIMSANIVYEYSSKPSLSEIWDSAFGVNVKKSIENRNYAPGGCLFIKQGVFDTLGLFQEGLRSGGDYTFTNTAVNQGYKLMFCENAVVKYPAKKFPELKKKAIRVGRGQIRVWLSSGRFWRYFVKFLFKPYYPPSPKRIHRAYESVRKSSVYNRLLFAQLFFLDWYFRLLQCYGNLFELTSKLKTKLTLQKENK